MNEFRPLFICGMSRGGTTWLGHCLNEHPQVAVFGESLYWGRNYLSSNGEGVYTADQVRRALALLAKDCKAFLGEGSGNLKQISREQWKALLDELEVAPCSPASLFKSVCELVKEREAVDFVIEKTPHHVNWIPRIMAAYADAKFVVMVRDPYGFMLSYKHQGDRKSGFAKRDLQAMYHPLGCAYMWKGYMNSALRMHRSFEAQTHLVQFEELRSAPEKCWKEVLDFFELPAAALVPVNDRNSSFTGVKRTLEPIDIFWMNLVAGRAIRAGGYSKRASGVTIVELLKSIGGLIPWGFRAVKLLRSRVPGGLLKYFFKLGK